MNNKAPERLLPGSAIGAQLMSGDMDVTAVGTVTWVKDQESWLSVTRFSMPASLKIPITSAYIATVMESKRMSFKLGFPVKPIGTLYQDRLPGGLWAHGGEMPDDSGSSQCAE